MKSNMERTKILVYSDSIEGLHKLEGVLGSLSEVVKAIGRRAAEINFPYACKIIYDNSGTIQDLLEDFPGIKISEGRPN